MASIRQPAALALLADAAQVNTWQAPASAANPMLEEWYYIDSNTNQPNGHFRHIRKGNALFCDGHAESEVFAPGSLDPRLPREWIGRYRAEIINVP
jgi:prepilin-type processing-associated H-X9-DG protein